MTPRTPITPAAFSASWPAQSRKGGMRDGVGGGGSGGGGGILGTSHDSAPTNNQTICIIAQTKIDAVARRVCVSHMPSSVTENTASDPQIGM